MSENNVSLEIQFSCDVEDAEPDLRRLRSLIKMICSRFDVPHARISIAIVNDSIIESINREYLNHDYPTDVISFDLSEADDPQRQFEVMVNWDEAVRQSRQRGHSPQAELALYVTHGLLHNLGYDDGTDSDSEKMHQMEDELLQNANYGIIYRSMS
jgi:probable rRNA maturation factor